MWGLFCEGRGGAPSMALTDVVVRAAKPKEKAYKIADGKGLFLLVKPNGGKYWRFRYQLNGKGNSLALGVYPQVALKDARTLRDAARQDLDNGIDPAQKKRTDKLLKGVSPDERFESVARDWYSHRIAHLSSKYAQGVMNRLEADVFPHVGDRKISEISAVEMLAVLRSIENRGALVTAHTIRSYCSQIFRFAIASGKAQRDTASDLRGALKVPNRKHFSRLEEHELPQFLQKLMAYEGDAQTQTALRLMIYTLVRTTEVRGARWNEVNTTARLWTIPAERMKMKEKHVVPLSDQALELLERQRKLSANGEFIFPNRQKPRSFMSENTMLFAIYRMGYHGRATGHGFRSTGSTILNENGFNRDHIERQLAHADRDQVRATYNYADYLPQRAAMMQWWADYLDGATRGIN